MLREKVLNTWEDLKDTILGNQQYQLGKLLRDFRITSFASNLTTEQVVAEINKVIERNGRECDILKNRINSLKNEANKRMILDIGSDDSDSKNFKQMERRFESLKSLINKDWP